MVQNREIWEYRCILPENDKSGSQCVKKAFGTLVLIGQSIECKGWTIMMHRYVVGETTFAVLCRKKELQCWLIKI